MKRKMFSHIGTIAAVTGASDPKIIPGFFVNPKMCNSLISSCAFDPDELTNDAPFVDEHSERIPVREQCFFDS